MFTEPLDFIHLKTYLLSTHCVLGTMSRPSASPGKSPRRHGHFPELWRQIPAGPGEGFWSKDERVPAFREVSTLRAQQVFGFGAGLPLAGWRRDGSPASLLTIDASALICALWFPTLVLPQRGERWLVPCRASDNGAIMVCCVSFSPLTHSMVFPVKSHQLDYSYECGLWCPLCLLAVSLLCFHSLICIMGITL